ncbi:MAG: 1-aminocyclopropane-1-carboxylate deaminase/D-cysteine desulfhydrase [Micromonosporaceae bacterium]
MLELRLPSPVEELFDDRLASAGVRLWLKRDDLVKPDLPGNKWRKLKHNMTAATMQGHDTVLTFGDANSDHIRVTAEAGAAHGLRTIGVIADEEGRPLTRSLEYAMRRGMRVAYIDRTTYWRKASPDVIASLRRQHGAFYLIPEGGNNELALRGCAELPAEIGQDFDFICCPCGTGGTLAGIAAGLTPKQKAVGFSVLKDGEFLAGEVSRLQRQSFGATSDNWSVESGFHFGGFGEETPELAGFIKEFEQRHRLRFERVYVAKLMYGIFAMAGRGSFPPGSRVIAVITGSPTRP